MKMNRSADWQSAVSRIGNPQPSQRHNRPADCQSAKQQINNLHHQRIATENNLKEL
jgi:hypothetical protein